MVQLQKLPKLVFSLIQKSVQYEYHLDIVEAEAEPFNAYWHRGRCRETS